MTVDELKNMSVKIRCYAIPDDNEPAIYTRCYLGEALEVMKSVVKDAPEKFYNLTFYVYTEEEEYLFAIQRDLEDIYFGRENKYNLTRDIVRETLGIVVQKKNIDELVRTLNEMTKVLILGFPDPYTVECNDYIHRCVLKDSLYKMNKHLDELDLDERGRLGYDFSVLLVGDDGDHKLIYSYDGDRNITVRKEFKDILSKLGIRDSYDYCRME